jgi:phage anti-repressor protein
LFPNPAFTVSSSVAASRRLTVSARELHEFLEIDTPFHKWFPRMAEYGFSEEKDYSPILGNRSDGLPGKPRAEHIMCLDMAKHISMIQRNEKVSSRIPKTGHWWTVCMWRRSLTRSTIMLFVTFVRLTVAPNLLPSILSSVNTPIQRAENSLHSP